MLIGSAIIMHTIFSQRKKLIGCKNTEAFTCINKMGFNIHDYLVLSSFRITIYHVFIQLILYKYNFIVENNITRYHILQ